VIHVINRPENDLPVVCASAYSLGNNQISSLTEEGRIDCGGQKSVLGGFAFDFVFCSDINSGA
jgi:hypothetical protein